MTYRQSLPIMNWFGVRRQNIDTLAQAHAAMCAVDGRGRPSELGRPIGHAYVLRMVSEFQAFVRDLHDLMAELIVDLAGTHTQHRALLMTAATEGRQIDRGMQGWSAWSETSEGSASAPSTRKSQPEINDGNPWVCEVIAPATAISLSSEMPSRMAISVNWNDFGSGVSWIPSPGPGTGSPV